MRPDMLQQYDEYIRRHAALAPFRRRLRKIFGVDDNEWRDNEREDDSERSNVVTHPHACKVHEAAG